jgi:hypothetical protein
VGGGAMIPEEKGKKEEYVREGGYFKVEGKVA